MIPPQGGKWRSSAMSPGSTPLYRNRGLAGSLPNLPITGLQQTPSNWRFCSTTKVTSRHYNQGIVGIFVSLARVPSGISSLPHVHIISSVAVPPYPSAAPSPERPLRLAPHVATALVRFAVQVQGTPGPNVLLAVLRESAKSEARFWPDFDVLSR